MSFTNWALGTACGLAETLLINGQWSSFRPFDIAPDRAFAYDSRLFIEPTAQDRDATLMWSGEGSPQYLTMPGGTIGRLRAALWTRKLVVSSQWIGQIFVRHERNISAGCRTTGWSALDSHRPRVTLATFSRLHRMRRRDFIVRSFSSRLQKR